MKIFLEKDKRKKDLITKRTCLQSKKWRQNKKIEEIW